MPYCTVPWTNIDISPQGEIRPCCKFKNAYPHKPVNINDNTITDYLNSPTLGEVKRDFMADKWPKGCERCKIEEDSGIESMRMMEQNKWKDYSENHRELGFLSASIAFGNTCNLTCITCDPYSSSKWYQEYKKLYGISIKPNHFYKEGFVENFYNHAENLFHLDVPGGEPFLSGVKQQKELLNKFCQDGRAKDITLHYTTNCTHFPEDDYIKLWKDFKQVEVQLSIDGIEKRLEYIRYPAEWNVLVRNVNHYLELSKRYTNIKLSISTTVSAYNIGYLDELFDWAYTVGLEKPWLGRVHNPNHLRPTIWPDKAKQYLIEKLQSSKHDLQSFANLLINEDDTKHFEIFKYRLLRHDQHRKLSFKNTFPEMYEFLKIV